MPNPSSKFPTKSLFLNEPDNVTILSNIVPQFTARITADKNRLAEAPCIDAPYIPKMISLGNSYGASSPIYKINIPGYFLRTGDNNVANATGILVANTPANISNSNTRIVFCVASDGIATTVNNMYAILPGGSTYAYIVRSTNSADKRRWWFVPTVFSASCNIASKSENKDIPESYVTEVGTATISTLTGTELGSNNAAFADDWRFNFKSVCGWNVANEAMDMAGETAVPFPYTNGVVNGTIQKTLGTSELLSTQYSKLKKITFLNATAKKAFKKERVEWILSLKTAPGNYGYLSSTAAYDALP